jgi:carbon storage regulator
MLVLSRQRDQVIMIGDDIEVVIVDIRGDKVRLGITAPKEVAVHRKEVYDQIKRENAAAANMQPADLPPGATVPTPANASPQTKPPDGGNRRPSQVHRG